MKSLEDNTLNALADIVCGGGVTYRTATQIVRFFRQAGLACPDHNGNTRKWWTLERLREYNTNPDNLEKVVKQLADPREYGGAIDDLKSVVKALNDVLASEDLHVEYVGRRPQVVEVESSRPLILTTAEEAEELDVPDAIRRSLAAFRAVHHDARRVAFIMMQFEKTPAHRQIVQVIKDTMSKYGLVAIRADERRFNDSLLPNVQTYMHGCGMGIAVFERITSERFNPNVALEIGYMLAMGKPVCILKDNTLVNLHSDLLGTIYESFDVQRPDADIPEKLEKWLLDKDFITLKMTTNGQNDKGPASQVTDSKAQSK